MTQHLRSRDTLTRRAARPEPVQTVPRHTAADLARGAGAALLLLGLVAGIPALLLVVGQLHAVGMPNWSSVWGALTRPDDGHLFLAALTILAWLAWATFTFSVIVEAVAIIRGLPSPRLPLLSVPQHAAAALVATAAIVLTLHPAPTATPAAATTGISVVLDAARNPAISATAPHRAEAPTHAEPSADASRDTASRHPPAAQGTHRTVTVHRGDTLWGLAERHLGDGTRFREIAQLNYGRPQPDGRTLTDTHWIYPGWVLLLPTPAERSTPSAANHHPEPNASKPHTDVTYQVRHGDSLWSIAEHHLGDGQRWREIYQLNLGRDQRLGGRLTDPDVILTGWILKLPPTTPHGTGTVEHHHPGGTTRPSASPTTPGVPAPARQVQSDPRPEPTPATSAAGPRFVDPSPTPSTSAAVPAARAADLDSASVGLNQIALGLTVLTAAGIVAELTRRRRRQQQRRRPGNRLPMPDAAASTIERTLRAHQDPLTIATLTQAFAALAATCRARGRELPRVQAITLSADVLELHTDDPGDPVEPFTLAGSGVWRLNRDIAINADADPGQPNPYPALVTIGTAGDSVVLLNLEAAGTLTVTGDQGAASDVLRALAVELATSALATATTLVLPAEFGDLAAVSDTGRVQGTDRDDATGPRVDAVVSAVSEILLDAGVTDVNVARSRGLAPDTWTPHLFITPVRTGAQPWSGVAVLTATPSGPGWDLRVDADGTGILDPLGLVVRTQRITAEDFDSVVGLLTLATDPEPGVADGEESQVSPQLPPAAVPSAPRLPSYALYAHRDTVSTALPSAPISEQQANASGSVGTEGPRVCVLGRVEVRDTQQRHAHQRKSRAEELVVYLALHPGASAHEIDEAMWPGRRVTVETRNTFVSRARSWLGSAPDNAPYLPFVAEAGDYRVSDAVSCDWHDFLRLAHEGLATGHDGADALERALQLVRGRPFLGIDPTAYIWAESDAQEMTSSIVDIAHELCVIRLDQHDTRAALKAAARGLLADPASELLYGHAIRAAALEGQTDVIDRLVGRLRAQTEAIDPDAGLSDEIIELLSTLSRS
jgi:nucleoid-associated protein YgaU